MPKLKSKGKNQKAKVFGRKLSVETILRNVLGVLFVIFGFIFLFTPLDTKILGFRIGDLTGFTVPTIPQKAIDSKEPIKAGKEFETNKKESEVVRIVIPNRSIDIEVNHAKIKQGYWETSEDSASHGEGTANPGEKGNVVIFAHAREGFFYNLKDAKKDDVVYVFTKDQWYKYKVSEIKNVYPNNVETVAPTKDEVLTLFTCSGFFDEKRLIVKAYPAGNSE